MMTNNKLPASIREAAPHNFDISKNDMADPQQGHKSPEEYVNRIINDWVCSITSELLRNRHPDKWARYPEMFGYRVVMQNDLFPSSLPIGFVLVSFFLSVYPRQYRVNSVRDLFNRWISAGSVREELFRSWKQGKFFQERVTLEGNDKPDGLGLSKSLYEPAQQDMFDQG